MSSNRDDGIHATGIAEAAILDAKTSLDYYEQHAAAGGYGVPIVSAGSSNEPQPVTEAEAISGVHP